MDREGWQATLHYWLECGFTFRSGDRLEFASRPPPIASQAGLAQPSSPSAMNHVKSATRAASGNRATSGNRVTSGNHTMPPATVGKPVAATQADRPWPNVQTVAQPQKVAFGSPAETSVPPGHTPNTVTAIAAPAQSQAVLQNQPILTVIPSEERHALFAKAAEEIKQCEKCGLARTRNHTVFGVGTPDTSVVFVGEGPGADEDLQGTPFVGQAGKLLDQMFRAISMTRSEIYIANVVKCRPPGNRNPENNEMLACRDYLFRQLEIIRPKVIFTLGKVALLCFTGYSGYMGTARGRPFLWRQIPIIASYHPAYYLRNAGRKKAAWEDLIRLLKVLEK